MRILDKLRNWVVEEEYTEPEDREQTDVPAEKPKRIPRIVLYEPGSYQEALKIADSVLDGDDAVINISKLEENGKQRLTDFLCGVTYRTKCEVSFTGKDVMLCKWK